MTDILPIIVEAAKDNSYSWLIAASLPPALYYLTKKRKQSWLQKLFMKWVMKRAARRAKKGKKMSDGAAVLIAILALLVVGALIVLWLGWLWAVIIICTVGFIMSLYGRK